VGALLKKLFLIWRECASINNISSIEDTWFCLLIRLHSPPTSEFFSIPKYLVKSEAEKHTVLTMARCNKFVALFHSIVAQMLKGE
jgi:hypothetical protein